MQPQLSHVPHTVLRPQYSRCVLLMGTKYSFQGVSCQRVPSNSFKVPCNLFQGASCQQVPTTSNQHFVLTIKSCLQPPLIHQCALPHTLMPTPMSCQGAYGTLGFCFCVRNHLLQGPLVSCPIQPRITMPIGSSIATHHVVPKLSWSR